LIIKFKKKSQKQKKKFGENFDKEQFVSTNSRILNYKNKISDITKVFSEALEKDDLKALKKLIEDLEIACPVSGSKKLDRCKTIQLNVWH